MTGQHRDIEPRRLLPWVIGSGCVLLVVASLAAMHVGDNLSIDSEPDATVTAARTTTAARNYPVPSYTPPVFPTPADVLAADVLPERTPETACSRCGERAPMVTATPERPAERRTAPRPTLVPEPPVVTVTEPTAVATPEPEPEPEPVITLEPQPIPQPTPEPTEPAPTTPPLIDLPDVIDDVLPDLPPTSAPDEDEEQP